MTRQTTEDQKNTGNIAGGYKATLKNPRVSEEAKEHAQETLEQMEERGELQADAGKNPANVVRGHKAAVNNPRVSDEAKEHSHEVLQDYSEE